MYDETSITFWPKYQMGKQKLRLHTNRKRTGENHEVEFFPVNGIKVISNIVQ